MNMRAIGTDDPFGKGYRQTFSSLPFKGYEVVGVKNRYRGVVNRLKWLPVSLPPTGRIYLAERNKKIDLLHFWNKINLNKQPWIISAEGAIFYFDFLSKRSRQFVLRKLASKHCRKILPFSQCACNEIDRFLTEDYPAYRDRIVCKMEVSLPVQNTSISDYREKKLDPADIVFTMVGNEFFRKGGEEILCVFDQLLQKKYPIKLKIVSRLTQKYRPFSGENIDVAKCRRIIDRYPNKIIVTQNLSHENVIELFKTSHVGLLPSYSDTFGYSALEAQSAGCPVITTDVRAFCEFNNESVGWVIDVPKDDKLHDALMWTPKDKARTSAVLRESLLAIVEDIICKPLQIKAKGLKALNQIREKYDPRTRALKLEMIYDSVTG